jgi:hypothetical protein
MATFGSGSESSQISQNCPSRRSFNPCHHCSELLEPQTIYRSLEARQFDLFHPRAREPQWLLLPKEARQTVANLMARILRERVLRNRRTEAPGGSRDY